MSISVRVVLQCQTMRSNIGIEVPHGSISCWSFGSEVILICIDKVPHIQLRSSSVEIKWAVYANDELESCTIINLQGQYTQGQIPVVLKSDAQKPIAVMRWALSFTDIDEIDEIDILNDRPAGDIHKIVMLALMTFQRRERMLITMYGAMSR